MQKLMLMCSLEYKNVETYGFFSGEIFWLKTTRSNLKKPALE